MANRKRSPEPLRIIINDGTRPFWMGQEEAAEKHFQLRREDKAPASSMTDEEWRRLLNSLSRSCRKTAELLTLYIAVLPQASKKEEKPTEVKRRFSDPMWETMRKDPNWSFTYLLSAAQLLWDGAKQCVGGPDKGLEFLAQYFDAIKERPRGRRPKQALTELIRVKLIAWLAIHGDRNICHWNEYREKYEGGFLDAMERFLRGAEYNYKSRNALAQRIKVVREGIVVCASIEESTKTTKE